MFFVFMEFFYLLSFSQSEVLMIQVSIKAHFCPSGDFRDGWKEKFNLKIQQFQEQKSIRGSCFQGRHIMDGFGLQWF